MSRFANYLNRSSSVREIPAAHVPIWLESLEQAVQSARGLQYEEIERGLLALWISDAKGEVTLHVMDPELTREFRHHDGVRWEILEAHDDGRLQMLRDSESSIIEYFAARP